jgi:hypothetical protein
VQTGKSMKIKRENWGQIIVHDKYTGLSLIAWLSDAAVAGCECCHTHSLIVTHVA